jgi:hypothetical protein
MNITMPAHEQLMVDDPASELDKISLPGHDGNPSRARCILTLPDELLNKILEYSVLPEPTNGWGGRTIQPGYDPAMIMTVALTCRRFSQILVPFFYRETFSDYNMRLIPMDPRLKLILRTLKANPSLGLHCRVLNSNISEKKNHNEPDKGCRLAQQLPALVPNIKKLYLRGCFGKARNKLAWKFLAACVRHMHQLEDVNLQRHAHEGLEVAGFLPVFQDSSLKRLQVGGFVRSSSRIEDLKVSRIMDFSNE